MTFASDEKLGPIGYLVKRFFLVKLGNSDLLVPVNHLPLVTFWGAQSVPNGRNLRDQTWPLPFTLTFGATQLSEDLGTIPVT